MEGLERSSELSRVSMAAEHSRSRIWNQYSGFKLGLLQPALRTWSCAKRIVFDSSVPLQPLTVLYSEPSKLRASGPQRTVARRHNACDARDARA
jgi:hypothetical protein